VKFKTIIIVIFYNMYATHDVRTFPGYYTLYGVERD